MGGKENWVRKKKKENGKEIKENQNWIASAPKNKISSDNRLNSSLNF